MSWQTVMMVWITVQVLVFVAGLVYWGERSMSKYFFSTHIIVRSLLIWCSSDMPLHFLSGHGSLDVRLVFHYDDCPLSYLGKFTWPPQGRNKSVLCEHKPLLSSVELLHCNKLQRCCSRQQTPLVRTQGTFASHRVTQFHQASPSPLSSSFFFFFCVDWLLL